MDLPKNLILIILNIGEKSIWRIQFCGDLLLDDHIITLKVCVYSFQINISWMVFTRKD